ncbi:MAG: peptide MFS transporter [Bacteroidetes bacterium]|nr:peptide MFS transporter [Bacteroidota bacterium]
MKHKHPKGLSILFFTELWERFSYYGMRAILVLYLTRETLGDNPGLGWSSAEALALYGWYTMLVYVMSIPGGIIADKWLGQKKTVFLGGMFIAAGHLTLAVNNMVSFYTGLALIIAGVGCLKPNISTMVGGLYKQGDPQRDSGFTIFYIGINIGAALAPLLVGYIGEVYGWHYGFGLAGIAMLIGQTVFLWGQKYLIDVGNFIPAPKLEGVKTRKPLTRIEKDRVIVLLISFVIVIVFWAAYEQAGGLMNIYTHDKINRELFGFEIPASLFQSVPAIFVIMFGTIVASFWSKRNLKGKESSSLFKMAIGTMVMGTGFLMMTGAAIEAQDGGKAMLIWLILAYLLQVIGELSISPVALSFISKLAPLKYASIMMGIYFAATGLGSKVAGLVGELATYAGELEVFAGIFIFCLLFGSLLLVFFKKLKALTHGAEEITES